MATWVVGDIHGMFEAFMKLLEYSEIKKDDTVILIGDIIDRGPDSYKMLKWAMENVTESGRYQMVLGNHEDNIIYEYHYKLENKYSSCTEESDIFCLDSQYAFDAYMCMEGFETLGSVRPFVEWFETLPLYKKVTVTKHDGTEQRYVIAHAWFDMNDSNNRDTLLWYRDNNPYDPLLPNGFYPDYEGDGNEILVHGHTPVFNENGFPAEAKVFIRKSSINIDCGACFRKMGGRLACIRLEDQKVLYADGKGVYEGDMASIRDFEEE